MSMTKQKSFRKLIRNLRLMHGAEQARADAFAEAVAVVENMIADVAQYEFETRDRFSIDPRDILSELRKLQEKDMAETSI